ncbi:MAG: PIN domain-containing protein [Kiloniellales bacterium]
MNVDRVTIDTNILVYTLDRAEGEKRIGALQVVEKAVTWDCVMILQVLNEFFSVMTGKGRMAAPAVAQLVEEWLRVFPVQAAGPGTLRDAMVAVQEHRLPFWDAMLWATAREAGCTLLLSENFQHGQVLGGVRFHNPFLEDVPSLAPD